MRGDYDRAAYLFNRRLAMHKALGDRHGIALILSYFTDAALMRGEYGEALDLLKQCMGLVRGMSAKVNMIEALESFAKIAALTNEPERAARLYGAASAARVAAEMPCAPARQSNNERHQAVSRQQIGDNA